MTTEQLECLYFDRARANRVRATVDAEWVRSMYRERYGGVGWQQRLAKVLHVAPATLSAWLKKDKNMPNYAKMSLWVVCSRMGGGV